MSNAVKIGNDGVYVDGKLTDVSISYVLYRIAFSFVNATFETKNYSSERLAMAVMNYFCEEEGPLMADATDGLRMRVTAELIGMITLLHIPGLYKEFVKEFGVEA